MFLFSGFCLLNPTQDHFSSPTTLLYLRFKKKKKKTVKSEKALSVNMKVNQLALYQTKKAINLLITFLCSKYFIVRDVVCLVDD